MKTSELTDQELVLKFNSGPNDFDEVAWKEMSKDEQYALASKILKDLGCFDSDFTKKTENECGSCNTYNSNDLVKIKKKEVATKKERLTKEERIKIEGYKYHGLSEIDRKEILLKHGYFCDICRVNTNRLNIDHCHTTGAIRGVLCSSCNWALGHFKDNLESLKTAKIYLEKHKA